MTTLEDARVSVAEAAYVSGVSSREINREIDAKVINATGQERRLRGSDLVYLVAVKDLRSHVDLTLRRSLRRAIATAFTSREPIARYATLMFPIGELRQSVASSFEKLQWLVNEHIEKRSDVLGGEPVIRGTRVAVHHVADLTRLGATSEDIENDLDLSGEQVRAALAYAYVNPRRGRPTSKRFKTPHVSATR